MLLLSEAVSSSLWPSLSPLFLISFVWQIVAPVYFCLKNRFLIQAIWFSIRYCNLWYSKITRLQSLCWTFDIDAPCDFLPGDSTRELDEQTTLCALLSNTDTTLRARLSKSRLLSPPPLHINLQIFLFTQGLLGCLQSFVTRNVTWVYTRNGVHKSCPRFCVFNINTVLCIRPLKN